MVLHTPGSCTERDGIYNGIIYIYTILQPHACVSSTGHSLDGVCVFHDNSIIPYLLRYRQSRNKIAPSRTGGGSQLSEPSGTMRKCHRDVIASNVSLWCMPGKSQQVPGGYVIYKREGASGVFIRGSIVAVAFIQRI